MSLASPENDLERSVAAQMDSIYESGWNEAIDAFATLLRSAWCDLNYPADAHAFMIHDKLLANIISKQLKETNSDSRRGNT